MKKNTVVHCLVFTTIAGCVTIAAPSSVPHCVNDKEEYASTVQSKISLLPTPAALNRNQFITIQYDARIYAMLQLGEAMIVNGTTVFAERKPRDLIVTYQDPNADEQHFEYQKGSFWNRYKYRFAILNTGEAVFYPVPTGTPVWYAAPL